MADLLTIRDLRKLTGQPAHILNHALDRHGPQPAERLGLMRLWRRDDLPAIEASLAKTAQRSTLAQRRAEAVR